MSDSQPPHTEENHDADETEAPGDAPAAEKEADNPRVQLFYAAILGASAVFIWWYLTDFENSNETSRRMNSILAMLYNLGGKWLPVGLFAAMALWQGVSGVQGMQRGKG
jgi:hypothetical protein